MERAKIPASEAERLKALYDYHVLDTDAEKVFDDLTLLASEICQTPIALISLVDPDRQWFKSKVGLDASETHRDIAFCSHAILQDEIFEVADTLCDERFEDNPLVTDDPNIRFYAGTPLKTPDGHAIGTLCAIDREPRRLTEHQRRALEILGREVISQLELRAKMRQLHMANQRKSEFLSTISHELRTPLNAIISFAGLMQSSADFSALPAHFADYIRHIDFSGKRLLSLVNSVLDLSKIEEGRMEVDLVKVPSQGFFKGVFSLLDVAAEEKGVTFATDISESLPDELVIDEAKLSQILLNLAGNAIKFTDPGRRVDVTVMCTGGQLVMVIKDQGRGISAEDQEKLFVKFERASNSKDIEGTGLGLVITQALVDVLKGRLKLSSALDKGTLVKVTLPLHSVAEARREVTDTGQCQHFDQQARLLTVEDNAINREVVKAVFNSLGLTTTFAESGEQALAFTRESAFDLVFMDLHLPGLSGAETAREIKRSSPSTPIVALSADAFAGLEQDEYADVLDGFLTKPLEVDKLVAVLNTYIPA